MVRVTLHGLATSCATAIDGAVARSYARIASGPITWRGKFPETSQEISAQPIGLLFLGLICHRKHIFN